jgi:hypothetical protein
VEVSSAFFIGVFLSFSLVDDSACDLAVNLMGIFTRYLLFFPQRSSFAF